MCTIRNIIYDDRGSWNFSIFFINSYRYIGEIIASPNKLKIDENIRSNRTRGKFALCALPVMVTCAKG